MLKFHSPRLLARMSGTAVALLFILSLVAAPAMAAPGNKLPKTMLPLKIKRVEVHDGQLVAIGSLGDHLFEAPIEATARPSGGVCPILDLALGPISLDLLGLAVDTSPICLAIDAESGEGALLGNLLCGIAGLLDGGLDLGDILGALTEDDLGVVLDGITDLLNGALKHILAPSSIVGVSSSDALLPEACDILNLSLGPVELDLLGLVVELDDCDGGPVTVDITAVPGEGNLLGNLLCDLAGLLDGGADPLELAPLLRSIASAILALL